MGFSVGKGSEDGNGSVGEIFIEIKYFSLSRFITVVSINKCFTNDVKNLISYLFNLKKINIYTDCIKKLISYLYSDIVVGRGKDSSWNVKIVDRDGKGEYLSGRPVHGRFLGRVGSNRTSVRL